MGTRSSVRVDRSGTPTLPLRPNSRRSTTIGVFKQMKPRHVVVLVLGDVGRSPRMQYHAMSLASHGVRVTLVGYRGERCISPVEDDPRISSHRFDPPMSGPWGRRLKRRAYLLFAAVKALALLARVAYELGRTAKPDAILVQNPPSLPGLACVYLACLLRRCPMVLDWHNLGFTMFDRGPRHPLVWVTRRAEAFFGRRARINMTVSHAMRDWIRQNFGISEAYIVYDQPPDFFRPPTLPERHALFKRLAATSADFADAARALAAASSRQTATGADTDADADADTDRSDNRQSNNAGPNNKKSCGGARGCAEAVPEAVPAAPATGGGGGGGGGGGEGEEAQEELTPFTTRSVDGVYNLRWDRPALLVSSTSWTPDEDFSVLLEALRRFDSRVASGASPTLPLVMVVVTGKGPEKAKYVELMKATRMSKVVVCTAWLEPDDYPVLLGSADLGICLHTSTSGVDLPMKVVDMFGCGVPVCAVHFECLNELVQDGYNGCVFRDSTQLALQLEALLDGFPRGGCELDGYRSNVKEVKRWKENWDEFAWPLFAGLGALSLNATEAQARSRARRRRGVWGTGLSVGAMVEVVAVPVVVALMVLLVAPWISDFFARRVVAAAATSPGVDPSREWIW